MVIIVVVVWVSKFWTWCLLFSNLEKCDDIGVLLVNAQDGLECHVSLPTSLFGATADDNTKVVATVVVKGYHGRHFGEAIGIDAG